MKQSVFRPLCLRFLVGLGFLLGLFTRPALSAHAQEIPAGFRLIAEQPGVALYRKDYANGTPDYVQVIDLSQGASIDLLYGAPVAADNQRNQGMFGGPNPSFRQKTIHSYWDEYASSQAAAFCVANGQFFYMPESPTPLALPLLVDRQLLAEGFGYPQYPEKQLILALWPDHADILPLTAENLAMTTAESVIGGLMEEANKKPKNAVGRTFMGIWDRDGDLLFETVAIYTTQTATQAEAASTVRSFGAAKVMMLDGGGSTQLICQGQTFIDTTRAIPQAIGVTAGGQAASEANRLTPEAGESTPSAIQPSPALAESVKSIDPGILSAQQSAPPDAVGADTSPLLPDPQAPEEPRIEASAQASALETASVSVPPGETGQELQTQATAPLDPHPSVNPAASQTASVSEKTATNDQVNGLDVLLLPSIISPLSLLVFYFARRHVSLVDRV